MSSSHKAVVEGFLRTSGVVPVVGGSLEGDLNDANDMALEYISYAIKCYPGLPGILGKVKALARVRNGSADDERIYQNTLTELMALRFVSAVLNERIVGLESSSPNGKGAKKCDLESEHSRGRRFYEVKDLSSEVLTRKPIAGHVDLWWFDPANVDDVRIWVGRRVRECIEKGANFLMFRPPVGPVRDWPRPLHKWVTDLYPKFFPIHGDSFRVAGHGIATQPFFQGIYLLRNGEHVLMEF